MKRSIYLITTIALLLAACHFPINSNEELARADSLMWAQPDSALSILQSISANSLETQADSAYYALLLTQARDKNFIPQTDDSLIRIAVRYYDATNDAAKQASAYFYWGVVCREIKKSEQALTHYLAAEVLARKTQDLHLLIRIYNNIGYLYYAQDLNEQADSVFQKTEEMAILLKDSIVLAETLSQRGMIQMENDQNSYQEAEKLMQQALHIAKLLNNNKLSKRMLSSLSILYNRMGDGKTALEFAKQNLELEEDTALCYESYQLLGSAYYKIKQYDSATFYLNKALPSENYAVKAGVYRRLSDIAKSLGHIETSLEMEQNYSTYMDSLQRVRNRQANKVISAEKNIQIAHQQKKYSAFVNKYNYYFWFFITIAVLFFLYILRRNRNKNARLQEEKERLKDVQNMIQQQNARLKEEQKLKDEKIASLEQAIIELHHDTMQKQNLRNELNTLSRERDNLLESMQEYSNVETKMRRIIQEYKDCDKSELTMETADWLQLIAETDRRWNKITFRLSSKYNLSQEEIHLCCLYLTDLPISYFGCLLNCKRDTIHKKANRIVEKKMQFPHGATSLQSALKSFCC